MLNSNPLLINIYIKSRKIEIDEKYIFQYFILGIINK